MEFLITECDSHGIKVCADKHSQNVYRSLAQSYVSAGEFGTVHADGSESWACCADMRVAFNGELV